MPSRHPISSHALSDVDEQFCHRLGFWFSDSVLLDRALTHRSAGAANNERLEFLGDAILNFAIAQSLFRTYPDAAEGELTRLRAQLVRKESLAEVARRVDIGQVLRLGTGELKTGGRDRDSILADAVESIIAAIYLDAGIAACQERIEALFRDLFPRAVDGAKDPKTRLQEELQSRGLPLPVYKVSEVGGVAHKRKFTVTCTIPILSDPTYGTGTSRRKAEQAAAEQAISLLDA